MNSTESQNQDDAQSRLPQWAKCDFFCIHNYASAGNAPCGWRGRVSEVRHDTARHQIFCPHCGHATLLRIPRDAAFGWHKSM